MVEGDGGGELPCFSFVDFTEPNKHNVCTYMCMWVNKCVPGRMGLRALLYYKWNEDDDGVVLQHETWSTVIYTHTHTHQLGAAGEATPRNLIDCEIWANNVQNGAKTWMSAEVKGSTPRRADIGAEGFKVFKKNLFSFSLFDHLS